MYLRVSAIFSSHMVRTSLLITLLMIIILFNTVEDTLNVALNDSSLCVTSECTHRNCTVMLHISIVDRFSCTSHSSQNIMDGSCISLTTLQMNAACVPYHITVETYNKTIVHNESITKIRGQ